MRPLVQTLCALALLAVGALAHAQTRPAQVVDSTGNVRQVLDPPPPSVALSDSLITLRNSQASGYWIDPTGTRHPGDAPSLEEVREKASTAAIGPLVTEDVPPPLATVTIDSMTTQGGSSYTPYREFRLLGSAVSYFLSDGTSWGSGAGSYSSPYAVFSYAEMHGDTIRYFFQPEADSVVYAQTDYDVGSHSSQGTLAVYSPLVLEAVVGSTVAVMRGYVRIRDNTMTWYGEPEFNFFTSIAGSVVPFTNTYVNLGGPWTYTSLDAPFSYSSSGRVDFAHPLSTPPLLDLTIRGPRQVPAPSATQYGAVARFAGDVLRDVRDRATWSASPSQAGVTRGLLSVPTIAAPRLDVLLAASYTAYGITRGASQTISAIRAIEEPDPDSWPMFQADAAHTGYRPLLLQPGLFVPLWQRTVAGGATLNPVTAAGGMVFCSLLVYFPSATSPALFALSALDGSTLWSKSYGSVYSVNPPSYAYGNVYVQTGDHANDTYLHAIDAASGVPVFDTPHSAQWERYYAPTIGQGKVYVDGGYYGGMYRFDAFSGGQDWFNASLPQYDQWTPAIDDSNAYSYLGEYAPGLYVISRSTGALRFSIIDPSFSWNGWSMDGAAVVCGDGNIVAEHDGRLICFNVPTHRLVWQLVRAFSGQPSYHAGVIYAIDNGRLVAIDEISNADLWSWTPPSGALAGTVIVTDSHVLASTASATYAIGLASHLSEWSYPAGGALALGNNSLYVATSSGVLHAINVMDRPVATTLLRFDATASPDGVRVSWQLADPHDVTRVDLQRSNHESGPWAAVPAEATTAGDLVSVLDSSVELGGSYWYRLSIRFADGTRTESEPLRVTTAGMVANELRLLGAAPAAGPVRVRFGVAADGFAKLSVLDVNGRAVATLASGTMTRGARELTWNDARSLPAGVYFVRLEAPGYSKSVKMVLMR